MSPDSKIHMLNPTKPTSIMIMFTGYSHQQFCVITKCKLIIDISELH